MPDQVAADDHSGGRRVSPNTDVRMKGFKQRVSLDPVLTWIDEQTRTISRIETLPLHAVAGRVLARSVASGMNVPPFERSAMDGYAVVADACVGASDYNPIPLTVVGQSMPAQPYKGVMDASMSVRVMTGAPIPDGANAVVPAEYADEQAGEVLLTQAVSAGKHVGREGEDVRAGDELLAVGRLLRPQDAAIMASVGFPTADVVARPRVRVIVTGNELAVPGHQRSTFQIYDSNSSMLVALIDRDGGELESLRRVTDDRDAISHALTDPGADLILVSGGSSVGAEDHAPEIVASRGWLAIHGIAMRPSSPAGMGTVGDSLVFLLPGNPVSCLCAYDFFAGRALRMLGGLTSEWPYPCRRLTTSAKIVSAIGRTDYCRVAIESDSVRPIAISGASILSSTVRADGFVIVPEDSEGLAPGTEVVVYTY